MRKLLFATVMLAACLLPAKANTITNLGTNPTSGAGAFSNTDPGSVLLPACFITGCSGLPSLGGAFIDTYNFILTLPQTLTISFATNTFAGGTPQLITNFQGAVLNSANVVVLGPELGAPCNAIPDCQVFGGSAILGPGSYHLAISGNAGVDAGYGGNISTAAAVPLPVAGAGLPGLIAGMFGVGAWWRRRRNLIGA
jgi:hypothetical protein